jgi:hypothetical protein
VSSQRLKTYLANDDQPAQQPTRRTVFARRSTQKRRRVNGKDGLHLEGDKSQERPALTSTKPTERQSLSFCAQSPRLSGRSNTSRHDSYQPNLSVDGEDAAPGHAKSQANGLTSLAGQSVTSADAAVVLVAVVEHFDAVATLLECPAALGLSCGPYTQADQHHREAAAVCQPQDGRGHGTPAQDGSSQGRAN